jgi:deazaflavin-dependent oxidoreductase (nitroreductase family)
MLIFRIFTAIHVALYRLSKGAIGGYFNGSDVLLLTTTGRKSGKVRTVPLMYVQEGDKYLVTGSMGGGPKHPGWYWNATQGNQPVQIEVKDQVMRVAVEEALGEERDRFYQRFIDMNAQFAGYETKTARKIPVLILTPQP